MSQRIIFQTQNETEVDKFINEYFGNTEYKSSPDFIKIDKKKITIDIVRQIQNEIKYKPFNLKQRLILLKIQEITLQAQNAMLKLLEETKDYTQIILQVDNTNKLIDTVISRCLLIQSNTVITESRKEIYDFLKMDILQRLEYVKNIKSQDTFIQEIISAIIHTQSNILDIKNKIKILKDIQIAYVSNVSKKLILEDIAINI
jgi:DNA polymerase-3 subunit delta'